MTQDQEPTIKDNSTFSKVVGLFTRDASYNILSFQGKGGFDFSKGWGTLCTKLIKCSTASVDEFQITHVPRANLPEEFIPSKWEESDGVDIIEHCKKGEDQVRGLILATHHDDKPHHLEFNKFFYELVLRDSRLHFSKVRAEYDPEMAAAYAFADFFADMLKNTAKDDLWNQGGREYFAQRATYFTQRNLRIEAVLPAFPCKSSNTEKVYEQAPDRGEELALRRLIEVSRKVKEIYPPGLKVYIVSDGHVFSDCIGVDDDVVDTYTETLKTLYRAVAKSENAEDEDLIGFASLKDMFFNADGSYTPGLAKDFTLQHFTGTKIDEDSENSRKFMMLACDTDCGSLKSDLQEEGHPRLKLYRGFWKFMSEDLKLNDHCRKLSRKQLKKTVSNVSFEMIKRNDAYSNLVELMFPFHMRLSIHGHKNDGPKFGIKLIGDHCKVIKNLGSDEAPDFEDKLHIPTPWHNCIVYIDGHEKFYMTKAGVVYNALSQGHYTGGWVEGNILKGIGGYFQISHSSCGSSLSVSPASEYSSLSPDRSSDSSASSSA